MSGSDLRFEAAERVVLVRGLGRSGLASADALLERGARVVVTDVAAPASGPAARRERAGRAEILQTLGAQVLLDDEVPPGTALPAGLLPELVVLTDDGDPGAPTPGELTSCGVPVWSDAELAWRLRPTGAAPWLVVGGTMHGRRTVADLTGAVLRAAGLRAATTGGADRPIVESVLHPQPYPVLVVELTPGQAGRTFALGATSSAWTTPGGAPDAGLVHQRTELACIYAAGDDAGEQAVRDADVVEGCRAVGVTTGVPEVGMLGLVEDVLCDRAFVHQRRTSAVELATLADVRVAFGADPGVEQVRAVLTAAALARSIGVPASAVQAGLRGADTPTTSLP